MTTKGRQDYFWEADLYYFKTSRILISSLYALINAHLFSKYDYIIKTFVLAPAFNETDDFVMLSTQNNETS